MSYSRAAALEYLARTKGIRPHDIALLAEPFYRLAAAALGAIGVLVIAATIVAAMS
jgi:hypothetical protein